MCLVYDKKLTEQKLNYFKRNNIKEIIVWKVLSIHPPYSCVYFSPYCSYLYRTGRNEAIHNKRLINKIPAHITYGALHVYANRSKARKQLSSSEIVTRCRVRVEDIIAYGENNDIAVKALYIDKFSERK